MNPFSDAPEGRAANTGVGRRSPALRAVAKRGGFPGRILRPSDGGGYLPPVMATLSTK